MLWSRRSHLLLAVAAVAFLPLLWAASGAGRLQGSGVPGLLALQLAWTTERAAEVVDAWSRAGVLREAVRAVEWDFAFIACYVLLLGLAALTLGRKSPPPRDRLGLVAATLGAAAGVLDFLENLGLLFTLEQPATASPRITASLAVGKLALAAVALVLVAALALRRLLPAPPEQLQALDWRFPEPPAELLPCDLVMKGGITSGVVYPGAAFALAKRYRFVNIGGSSAGAIAAAVTAAAEYRRAAGGGTAGFEALREATRGLTAQDRVFHLFQPSPACAPLFDVIAEGLGAGGALARGLRAAWTSLQVFPVATLVAAGPALALAIGVSARLSPAGAAWLFLALGVLSAVLLPLALTVGMGWRAWRALPASGFGLCPGPTQPGARDQGLSDWLADRIDEIAFGPDHDPAEPLTLGHLWCGHPPTDPELEAERRGHAARAINLEVLTTSLTHGRPYRIPFDSLSLWFEPKELEKVLPARVVSFMVARGAKVRHREDLPPPPAGLVPLPLPQDLPVVFLARMSLSFPFLLAAPQLRSLRFSPVVGPGEEGPAAEEPDEAGEEAREPEERTPEQAEAIRRGTYQAHWFSDGGISSNFPIHFFDQPLPAWPTFGLDLGEAEEGRPATDRVRIAVHNGEGVLSPWIPVSDVGTFSSALFSSLHAWMDNMQKRAPGYRDRLARVDLTEAEGGMNLRMPGRLVHTVAGYGYQAGDQLGAYFDPRPPPAGWPPTPLPEGARSPPWAWNNHRWVRFRSTMSLVEKAVRALRIASSVAQPAGTRTYADLVLEQQGPAPSYRYRSARRRALAHDLATAVSEAPAGQGQSLAAGAPRPEPGLRIMPKV